MLNPADLRALGALGLTDLLRRRPEVLDGPPPRSLAEVAARLAHPGAVNQALARLDQPTLQVVEALAALGRSADRPRLARLLGVDDGDQALADALTRLRDLALLGPGSVRLISVLEQGWPQPLALGDNLDDILPLRTNPELGAVLKAWGEPAPTPLRKDALIAAVEAVLTDGDRVREAVGRAPDPLPLELTRLALRGGGISPWEWGKPSSIGARAPSPVAWARDRLLLVPGPSGLLELPAEVALALRGAHWHAPFTPHPPQIRWQERPPERVAATAGAAGARAVRALDDLLRLSARTPVARIKSGSVGVRELRRCAKAIELEPVFVRLLLALADHLGLVTVEPDAIVANHEGLAWSDLDPAPALAALVLAWLTLPDIPTGSDHGPFAFAASPSVADVRRVLLDVLADHPDAAPTDGDDLVETVGWLRPVPLGRQLGEVDDDDPMMDDEAPALDPARTAILAMVAEAEWLGVIADGTLSPAGRAALAGGDREAVQAAVASSVGAPQRTAVLQADLTATVLGHPGGDLTTVLDGLAEREVRSAATIWRFTPSSVRRALDTGRSAAELLDDLRRVLAGEVPQALAYLVEDVARRHGRLRGAAAVSYLRSDDVALLAEVAADRRLRRHGLRLLAPTVLVSTSPWPQLLDALRTAGHGPVEEGADGAPVLSRRSGPDPVAAAPGPRRPVAASRNGPSNHPSSGTGPGRSDDGLPELVAGLLTLPDQPRNRLIEIGQTVLDLDSLNEWMREQL